MANPVTETLNSKRLRSLPRVSLRTCALYTVPVTVTIAWLAYVLAADEFSRAIDQWEAAVMMIFGSFLAGSSPEGGGAVAFPILTKVLHVSAPVARTFSLSIQAVGMTSAAVVILVAHRKIETRAVLIGVPAGAAGLLVALFALGDPDKTFWPSTISAPYIKVTFTLLLAAMSYMVFVMLRSSERGVERVPHWNRRVVLGLALAAFAGGMITSFVGVGVNVAVFLFIVVMAGVHPRVGVPTSILIMASVSVIGFLTLSVFDGQFNLDLNAAGDVVGVGGSPVDSLPADRFDVLGLWLAAVPIVVWGAPLGTYVVHILREERMILFVALLAATEVVSTFVVLDQLHSDGALIAFTLLGLVVAIGGVTLLRRYRHQILNIPPDTEEPTGAA